MINPEEKKILEELGGTHYGMALKKFIEAEKEEVGDITAATDWEDTRGRTYAVNFMKKLLRMMQKPQAPNGTPKGKNEYV